ncbi:hypothetical protein KPL40_17870 [Clostridium gasigenes]|nr:hypothetical protein [Clostridium gasigenes]MBU3134289.1 hypothetical protein [Clostridium gasigenes]
MPKVIKDEEYDLYIYAFETLIAFIINILAILCIGCLSFAAENSGSKT